MSNLNVLVISRHIKGGCRILEDYCTGIKAHSRNYHYIDYFDQYSREGKQRSEAKIEALVCDHKIDCIFFIQWSGDLTFDLYFIERLSKVATIVMNFYDTEFYFEGVDRYYAQVADLVILPDYLSKYKYEHLGINVLTTFSMFDGNFYAKYPDVGKSIDVSFVGSFNRSDSRSEYIGYLRDHGISVETYGSGSDHGFVSFEQMVAIFNKSRINLNFTKIADSENYAIKPPSINQRIKQSKGRPIEVALCGSFVLSEYAPGIEMMFRIEHEMDTFATKEELLQKVQYYLSNEQKMTEIAARGYERARNDYEVIAGFEKVFRRIENIKKRPPAAIYVDPEFSYNFVAYRFFYLAYFVLNGSFKNMLDELRIILKVRKINFSKAYYFALKGTLLYARRNIKLKNTLKWLRDKFKIREKF